MDTTVRAGFFYLFLALIGFPLISEFCAVVTLEADSKSANYATPKDTFQTYIEAVRNHDLKAARECWVFDDHSNSGALDVIVGLWTSMRQINQVAESKFGREGLEKVLHGWLQDDLTDQAFNLTKKRVETAHVQINGNLAQLTIHWNEKDGYPNSAFMFSKEPFYFRKVDESWKLDANKSTGLKNGVGFFSKGSWGSMFRDQIVIMNEAVTGMQNGTLKSKRELALFIEEKIATMQNRPFVKGVLPGDLILIEDTKEHYVELRTGQFGVCSNGGKGSENRPDLKDLREINDSVYRICRAINGNSNPRIVVESNNKNYYQVFFKEGDRSALQVIDKPLGLEVLEEQRELPVITIRESKGGHKLKQTVAGTKDKRLWYGIVKGVTVDELAQFLETHYEKPVVNMTALKGIWSFHLSDEALGRRWGANGEEKIHLSDLGLVLQIEKLNICVTVVKDKLGGR